MKIYINQAHENWICDRIRDEFVSLSSPLITRDILEADLIWLLAPWLWRSIPLRILKSKCIIATVHHIDPSKFNLEEFLARDKFIDFYHVPNIHTFKDVSHLVDSDKIKLIPYWYNNDFWFPIDKKDISLSLELPPTSPLVIGSFQRDTEGSDLMSPKRCKGPDVFCDIVESFSPKPFIILAGWRRQYVIRRLQAANISFAYLENASIPILNELYNCLDVYLVTSRYEGGPQAILECAATKTPVFSTDVGIASNLLPPHYLCTTPEDFLKRINSALKFYDVDYNHKQVKEYELGVVGPQYLTFFSQIYESFNRDS